MDKQHILNEIRRTAKDGKAIGQILFSKETGIKAGDWRGKYWARWGDALAEAGFPQNDWNTAYDEYYVFERLLELTRKYGKYPTKYEMQLASREDAGFPSTTAIRRLGAKSDLLKKLLQYCNAQEGYEDVKEILKIAPIPVKPKENHEHEDGKFQLGYVYLFRSAGKYKIGYSKAALNRASVVSNLSPEGGEILHLIRTDDMRGIEAYWHNRFIEKRGNGEWFSLSTSDVEAFKRRKFM